MTNTVNNDEIDLREIFLVIWKRKYWIAGFVFIVCAITVFVVLRMDNIYESKTVLRPSQNDVNQMSSAISNLGGLASLAGINIGANSNVSPFDTINAIMHDDDFIYSFVTKNKFESFLIDGYEEIKKSEGYGENKKFYISKSVNSSLMLEKDSKSGIITVSMQSKNREFTKIFLNKLLVELSAKYKAIDMQNIQESIDNYKDEIDKTSDISLKNRLAIIVAGLIQNKVISQAKVYYGFDIIVEPSIPDAMDKVKPRRSIICLAVFISSVLFSAFVVLVYEKVRCK